MEQGAPTRQVKGRVTPDQRVRCSKLLTSPEQMDSSRSPFGRVFFHRRNLWRCILSCMKTRANVVSFPGQKRGSVTLRPKHRHEWYKSLAGGFRCACEVWRCEFAEESKQCDSAAEQGRKYCVAHLAFKPQ